jgi:hypothetical protein
MRRRVNSLMPISGLVVFLCAWSGLAQIQPYARNPSYWQYNGRPILLFGGSDRDNIFQWAGDGPKLTDHLDLLKHCGGNYIRCTLSSREYTPNGYRWDLLPYPFAKVNGKYDLNRWDDVYWGKLRAFLAETKKRGIIVQLEFWDRWNESGNSREARFGWFDSPWNPNNNVTYDWSGSPLLIPGKTDFYNAFHSAAVKQDRVLLPLQQRFIEKVINEVIDNGNDHVLFQVDNESGIGDETLEPDPYWARTRPPKASLTKSTSAPRDGFTRQDPTGHRTSGTGTIPRYESRLSIRHSTSVIFHRTTATVAKYITTMWFGTGRKCSSMASAPSTT